MEVKAHERKRDELNEVIEHNNLGGGKEVERQLLRGMWLCGGDHK